MTPVISRDEGILVQYLNAIIDEAITHGGDTGGPYCTNREKLVAQMSSFKLWYGLKDYIIVETAGGGFAYAKPVEEEKEKLL